MDVLVHNDVTDSGLAAQSGHLAAWQALLQPWDVNVWEVNRSIYTIVLLSADIAINALLFIYIRLAT